MRIAPLGAVLLATVLAIEAHADGLIYQLPADGTAALFETETNFLLDGQDRSVKGTLSIASVGQQVVDNETCRWIEVKSVTNAGGSERITIAKCLIPEQHLARGKSPVAHVVRGWIKSGDGEPQEVKELKSPGARILSMALAGPGANLIELESSEIDGKLGKLACQGEAGDLDFQRDSLSVALHYETRLHEKAPFGVVSALWKFDVTASGQPRGSRTTRLTLTDLNPTALSELPDRK